MTETTTPSRSGGVGLGLIAFLLSLALPVWFAYLLLFDAGFDLGRATTTIAAVLITNQIVFFVALGVLALAVLLAVIAIYRGSRLLAVLALLLVGATVAVGAFVYYGGTPLV